MHSKVLTYQKFQTWKSATACTGPGTGAENLETGIPLSRTSDISKLAITRTESSFLPSVQNCTLNFSRFSPLIFVSLGVYKNQYSSPETTAVFWCSYNCVVEWTNSPSRARVPFFFTIIRLGISAVTKRRLLSHIAGKCTPSRIQFWKFSGGACTRTPLEVRAFGPQFYRVPAYSQASALLLQKLMKTLGSYPFSETNFQDFSRTFQGLRFIFQGL